ncbi:MAG: hypothetical protein QXO76_00930 [Thermoproteota archaeon]
MNRLIKMLVVFIVFLLAFTTPVYLRAAAPGETAEWAQGSTFCIEPIVPGNRMPNFSKALMEELMSILEGILNQILQMIFGTQVRNLNETTEFISQSTIEGFKASTKTLIEAYMKPGVYSFDYCYYNYDPIKQGYFKTVVGGTATPTSGTNYFTDLIGRQTGQSGWPPISYPVPDINQQDEYVKQVGQATLLMAGPGTGAREFLAKYESKLPPHERVRLKGDIQRLDALTEANMNLAIAGAEASVHSRSISKQLLGNHPDLQNSLLFSQTIKDILKLTYIQNQMMARLIDLQGQMAIQMAAMSQLMADEYATKLMKKWIESAPAEK